MGHGLAPQAINLDFVIRQVEGFAGFGWFNLQGTWALHGGAWSRDGSL